MRRPLGSALAAALAVGLTLASTAVPRRVQATYPDILGCEQGCPTAAAGFPVPFVVDYPGLSPAGSASLAGAALGVDRVRWGGATLSFACWFAAAAAGAWAAGRLVGRPR